MVLPDSLLAVELDLDLLAGLELAQDDLFPTGIQKWGNRTRPRSKAEKSEAYV